MKKIFLILICLISSFIIGWLLLTKIYFCKTDQAVKISAHYINDQSCENWKVDKAPQSLNTLSKKDIKVNFKGLKIYGYLISSEDKSALSYSLEFEGKLKSTIDGKCIFEANSYKYTIPITIY